MLLLSRGRQNDIFLPMKPMTKAKKVQKLLCIRLIILGVVQTDATLRILLRVTHPNMKVV